MPHLLRNSAGLMWSSAAWASNGRSSRHLMGGAALQIAVPMSAAFVGAPIRALLSAGVRLHSLLCVLVKILQLAYKTTSRSAKLSDLHRPYLVARATYGLTSAWRASLQARPAPCALSTRVGAQLRRQSQHSEISPTALAGARGSQAHKGDLKRQDAGRPANPADGQVLRL